jgi:hypothetical protein
MRAELGDCLCVSILFCVVERGITNGPWNRIAFLRGLLSPGRVRGARDGMKGMLPHIRGGTGIYIPIAEGITGPSLKAQPKTVAHVFCSPGACLIK